MEEGRPGHRAFRRRMRALPRMPLWQPSGLRAAVPAGFAAWGSFAEYVAVDYADTNLVALPQELDFATAANLGCRFVTSFRAIVDQGRVKPGEWVAVHGCGGVGLSAIMIASAMGANVIAVDLTDEKVLLQL